MLSILENKKVTYALYFLILLILSKIVYLFLESNYNYDVLKAVSDYTITQDNLKQIETKGHILSSIGLSLLILPFAYLLMKRKIQNETNTFIFSIVFFIITSFIFYNLLTFAMNKIVEKNSDKRYEAYYTGLLKYGILSEKFGYEKFINKDIDIKNDITSTVLISNMFLLSFVDKEVVNKVREQGKDAIVDLYIEKVLDDQYEEDRKEFISKADQIEQAWEKYNDGKEKINNEFKKFTKNTYVQSDYFQFIDKMNKKYDDYSNAKIDFAKKRDLEYSKIDTYYNDLNKYFKYKGNSTAENKYARSMQNNFQKYIEPSRWCSGNVCPSKNKIRTVIDEELNLKWNKEVNLPLNLRNQKEFLKHSKVKKEVINELRKKGLNVGENFNYSSTHFYNAYNGKINKEHSKALDNFKKEFENKSGIKNISVNLNWADFVRLFEKDFIEKFDSAKYGKKAVDLIATKELNRFYNDLYRPLYFDKYFKDIFYSREDFQTDKLAQERGDNFIKMLYIPPFALFMSLLAGILNLLSVCVMIIFLPLESRKNLIINVSKFTFKIILLVGTLSFVYFKGNEKAYINNNVVLNLIDFQEYPKLEYYVKALNSIIYLEDLNKKIQSK